MILLSTEMENNMREAVRIKPLCTIDENVDAELKSSQCHYFCILWMPAVSLKTKKITCAGTWTWDPVWKIELLRTSIKRFSFQRHLLFSGMDLDHSWSEIEGVQSHSVSGLFPHSLTHGSIYLLNFSFIRATKANKAQSFLSKQRDIGKQVNKNNFLLLID